MNRNFFDSTMIEEIKKELLNPNFKNLKAKTEGDGKINSQITRQEKLLSALLVHDQIKIPSNYNLKYFTNPDVKMVLEHIQNAGEVTKEKLLQEDFRSYIEDAIFNFSQVDEQEDMEMLYNLIKKDYYTLKEAELKRKIAIAETQGNVKESEKLLKRFLKLTKEYEHDK